MRLKCRPLVAAAVAALSVAAVALLAMPSSPGLPFASLLLLNAGAADTGKPTSLSPAVIYDAALAPPLNGSCNVPEIMSASAAVVRTPRDILWLSALSVSGATRLPFIRHLCSARQDNTAAYPPASSASSSSSPGATADPEERFLAASPLGLFGTRQRQLFFLIEIAAFLNRSVAVLPYNGAPLSRVYDYDGFTRFLAGRGRVVDLDALAPLAGGGTKGRPKCISVPALFYRIDTEVGEAGACAHAANGGEAVNASAPHSSDLPFDPFDCGGAPFGRCAHRFFETLGPLRAAHRERLIVLSGEAASMQFLTSSGGALRLNAADNAWLRAYRSAHALSRSFSRHIAAAGALLANTTVANAPLVPLNLFRRADEPDDLADDDEAADGAMPPSMAGGGGGGQEERAHRAARWYAPTSSLPSSRAPGPSLCAHIVAADRLRPGHIRETVAMLRFFMLQANATALFVVTDADGSRLAELRAALPFAVFNCEGRANEQYNASEYEEVFRREEARMLAEYAARRKAAQEAAEQRTLTGAKGTATIVSQPVLVALDEELNGAGGVSMKPAAANATVATPEAAFVPLPDEDEEAALADMRGDEGTQAKGDGQAEGTPGGRSVGDDGEAAVTTSADGGQHGSDAPLRVRRAAMDGGADASADNGQDGGDGHDERTRAAPGEPANPLCRSSVVEKLAVLQVACAAMDVVVLTPSHDFSVAIRAIRRSNQQKPLYFPPLVQV